MGAFPQGTLLGCKECDGEFTLAKPATDYDPTYCPYCGSESLEELATGDDE